MHLPWGRRPANPGRVYGTRRTEQRSAASGRTPVHTRSLNNSALLQPPLFYGRLTWTTRKVFFFPAERKRVSCYNGSNDRSAWCSAAAPSPSPLPVKCFRARSASLCARAQRGPTHRRRWAGRACEPPLIVNVKAICSTKISIWMKIEASTSLLQSNHDWVDASF